MKSKINYVIIVSNDGEGTESLLEMLKDFSSSVKTDIAKNSKQLSMLVTKKLPVLIVILAKKPGDGETSFLSKIRKNKKMDKIPVLIYPVLPDKQDFLGFLRQL